MARAPEEDHAADIQPRYCSASAVASKARASEDAGKGALIGGAAGRWVVGSITPKRSKRRVGTAGSIDGRLPVIRHVHAYVGAGPESSPAGIADRLLAQGASESAGAVEAFQDDLQTN